ncbi:mannitol operon transcriptional antiterminator [Virgibacillus halotolerans]|uniref:BglG family transcription antiterminator n=1 Tax=Virgibacillus halotolerans TaxID=1071053 RepID=UPI0019621D54|nr:BglG family transcription antiterminator [Virgibacillus halotolerans]MBM7600012.1 mannitol operon transcriptional antiterminator [Virgibacillus halotolerans]
MDQRSMAVLNQLIQQDSYISVQALAKTLNVSRRTIYNDLDKIQYWLKVHQLTEIKQVRGQGLYMDEKTKRKILKDYPTMGNTYYEYSPAERRAWIFIHIAGEGGAYFLEDIRALFQVSRNTVLDDMKKLREQVKGFQLEIGSDLKDGYVIHGNEGATRQVLLHCLSAIDSEDSWYGILSNTDFIHASKMDQAYQPYFIFESAQLEQINLYLHEYEKQVGIAFTDDVLNDLVIWFHFFLKRISYGNTVYVDPVKKEVIKATEEYEGAKTLCHQLAEAYGITAIPEDEIYYFAKYLLGSKVNYNLHPQLESQEMQSLLLVVEKMVADFQLYAAVAFDEPQQMIQNLLLHLKPAYYRIKYGIKIENSLRDSVKQNYIEVFYLTKKVVHHFEDLLDQSIDENEIAFISMHFGGWLRKEGLTIEKSLKKLLIVCTNGLGTSRLLESQLEGLFSNVEIVGVTSLREYEKMQLNVDFIVSTITLPQKGVPVFVVNPVLNNEDKEQLLKKVNSLFEQTPKQQVYSAETVIDMVSRYATVHDDTSLRQELRNYFHPPISLDAEARKPSLYQLLPPERIIFKKRVSDWQEAIKNAASPLLEQGYIKESYIAKMIENVQEHGPYIVISDQFALPHASPEDGAHKTGMSMLHVTEPVDFLGKDVCIIIVLSSWDNEQHLKALSQLTKLFSNRTKKCSVIQTTDKQHIVELIKAQSNKEL